MFDGSHYPFEENLAKSTELVNVAHNLGLSIECEVGSIGGEEDGVVGMGECADPDECKTIADLGVDMLAAEPLCRPKAKPPSLRLPDKIHSQS